MLVEVLVSGLEWPTSTRVTSASTVPPTGLSSPLTLEQEGVVAHPLCPLVDVILLSSRQMVAPTHVCVAESTLIKKAQVPLNMVLVE